MIIKAGRIKRMKKVTRRRNGRNWWTNDIGPSSSAGNKMYSSDILPTKTVKPAPSHPACSEFKVLRTSFHPESPG